MLAGVRQEQVKTASVSLGVLAGAGRGVSGAGEDRSCFWSCCIAPWSYELSAFPIAHPDQLRSTFQDLNLVSILGVTRLKARCWTEGLLF